MNSLFGVGEIAITQGYDQPELNNLEVIVLGPMEYGSSYYCTGELAPKEWLYPVQWCDGDKTWEPYWHLRKRHPPRDDIDEVVGEELEA